MPELPQLPPVADQPLSVVLLARPGDPVESVLPGWLEFVRARDKGDELILVDDGALSQEEEGRVRASHGDTVRLVRHEQTRGEGAALSAGLAAATRPLLFYTVCLPDYRPEDLTRMLTKSVELDGGKPLTEIDHIHLIAATRAGVKVPLWLRAVGWSWRAFCLVLFSYTPRPVAGRLGVRRWFSSWLARVFFGVSYRDPACPFRLMRRDILARIPIQSTGPFAHVELLAKANFLGCLLTDRELSLDVVPPPYRGDAGDYLCDAKRLFDRPDFGPAELPAPEPQG